MHQIDQKWHFKCYKRFLFQINAVILLFYFLFIHQSILKNKMHHGLYKKMKQHNIDNNQKCFLSSKSVYYYDFWRSCDTEDWSNDAENTALDHRNKLYLNIYSNRNLLF